MNITEWLFMNQTDSFNASEYSEIYLEFFLDYEYLNGNEYAQVLYANGTSYPTFTNLNTWTASINGTQWLNLSAAAGENKVYLAFRYHGTNDSYMYIDDVKVVSKPTPDEYEIYMDSHIYQEVDLTKYDMVNLSYNYWLDSESGYDGLYVIYYLGSSWYFIDGHSGNSGGWASSYALIPTSATRVGFHFYSDNSISSYEGAYIDNISLVGYINVSAMDVQVDNNGWASATGTLNWNCFIDTTQYSDGQHNLSARGTYGLNYSFDEITLNIDNTPPSTFTPIATPGTWTNNTQPVLTFSTTDATSGVDYYSVKIDSGNFNNQSSPYTLPSLSDGTHTITVRAYDNAGNYRDSSVIVYIDTGKPAGFIVSANPSNWTNDTQPLITYATTDSPSGMDHYEVSIDSGGFSTQSSPYTLPSQSDGTHTITVRAFDNAVNYNDSSVNVYIDTTPPVSFTPTANPSGWSPNKQPVITFSTVDVISGVDYYAVQIDFGSFENQTSPYTLPPQNDGIHNITVRAFDLAGNFKDGIVKVYIDSNIPNPFTPTANPSSWTTNTQPIISFSTTDDTSGIDHYEVKIDSGSFSTQTSPYTLPPQGDGIHTITVRAFNNAGKYIDGSVKVYIDTSIPNPFTPVAEPNTWTKYQPVLTFNTTDDISGIDYFDLKIDSSSFITQTSPYTLPVLTDGVHNITIRAYDLAGNYIDGFVDVFIDTIAPWAFTPSATPSNWTNDASVIVFGTMDALSGLDRYELKIDSNSFSIQTSPYTIPKGALTDGEHKITVRAYDNASNFYESFVNIYLDTSAPKQFTPTTEPTGWSNNNQPTIYFETTDNLSKIDYYEVKVGDGEFTIQTSPYLMSTQNDGVHNITVRAYDNAGNYVEGRTKIPASSYQVLQRVSTV